MKQRRIIYFLSHVLMVVVGGAVALASGLTSEGWQATLFSIGVSIIAAGLCGMIVWVYVASSERGFDQVRALEAAGIEWAYPIRAAQIRGEYQARLEKAKRNIDILGFGLKDFRRDYMDALGSLSKDARIRILILDPESPYATQRDLEEGQSAGVIKAEVEEFIKAFSTQYPHESPNLQLRMYHSLPEVNIFRVDDEMFWGPYLTGKASGNTTTLRVRKGGHIFVSLEAHFNHVWEYFSKPPTA